MLHENKRQPIGSTNASNRVESVEVLRGIAAFAVMWFHLTQGNVSFLPSDSFLKASGRYGYLGVHLFFVISGFIIPYSLWLRKYDLRTDGLGFFIRRVVRIEPAYLASAFLILLLQILSALTPGSHAMMPESNSAMILAVHVAYLAPWFNVPWLSPVYWSLAIEFQYYLAILFLVSLLLSPSPWKVRGLLLLTVLMPLVVTDDRTLFPYLPLFGLGFLRLLIQSRKLSTFEIANWCVILLIIFLYVRNDPLETLAGIIAFGFLFLPISRPLLGLSFLGSISYSLFLVHVPIGGRIINLAVRLPPNTNLQILATMFAAAISILAAYAFWRLIEQPSSTFAKTIGSRGARIALR
jgi:peptidoglycan/LPS O-acetylase OafA/YrhL